MPSSSGRRPSTAARTRRSSRRMVSSRPLKSWRWSWIVAAYARQHRGLGLVERVQLHEVDREPGLEIGRLGEVDLDVGVARQQLVRRDLVDLGEAQEPRHGDGALTALVGAEHARLELETAPRLDVVQRESLLAADRAQTLPDMHVIHVSTTAPHDELRAPSRARLWHESPAKSNLAHDTFARPRGVRPRTLSDAAAPARPRPRPVRSPSAARAVRSRDADSRPSAASSAGAKPPFGTDEHDPRVAVRK